VDEDSESEDDEGDDSKDDDEEEEDEVAQHKHAEPEPLSTPIRLQRLTQLHILRFLRASPAFSFSAPSATHPGHTHLYTLLMGFVKLNTAALADSDSSQNQIAGELKRLVRQSLGKSIAFKWTGKEQGEDGECDEVDAWLDALPRVMRRVREVKRLVDANADDGQDEGEGKLVTVYPESLDGTPLMDERTSVVAFLEDCILRCIKTPYKYIEELEKIAAGSSSQIPAAGDQPFTASSSSDLPSPLLITMIEQLEAKLGSQAAAGGSGTVHLTPSDVLAIAVYLRCLLFALVGKFDCGFTSPGSSPHYLVVLQNVLDRLDSLGNGGV
jgi:nucleolar pre-ribosomal-associated protein 1